MSKWKEKVFLGLGMVLINEWAKKRKKIKEHLGIFVCLGPHPVCAGAPPSSVRRDHSYYDVGIHSRCLKLNLGWCI